MSVYKIAGIISDINPIFTRLKLLDPEDDKYNTKTKLLEIKKTYPDRRDPLYFCKDFEAVDLRGKPEIFKNYQNRSVIITCVLQLMTVKSEKKWKLYVKNIELINRD